MKPPSLRPVLLLILCAVTIVFAMQHFLLTRCYVGTDFVRVDMEQIDEDIMTARWQAERDSVVAQKFDYGTFERMKTEVAAIDSVSASGNVKQCTTYHAEFMKKSYQHAIDAAIANRQWNIGKAMKTRSIVTTRVYRNHIVDADAALLHWQDSCDSPHAWKFAVSFAFLQHALRRARETYSSAMRTALEDYHRSIAEADRAFEAAIREAKRARDRIISSMTSSSGEGASPACLPSDPALVGYWSLDDVGSTIARDISKNALHGMLMNMDIPTAWVTSGLNTQMQFANSGALVFDGTDDSVTLGAGIPLLNGVRAATISLWVFVETMTSLEQDIIAIGVNKDEDLTHVSRATIGVIGDRQLFVGGRASDRESLQWAWSATGTVQLGQWHHIAGIVRYDKDIIDIYIDGVRPPQHVIEMTQGTWKHSTGSIAWAQSATSDTLSAVAAIGGEDESGVVSMENFFQGKIDDVRIYARSLSAADIAALAAGQCEP